ncbi:hypothetical protein LIA77_07779 [Sarocladium implicatum]|nr:hypothetical protein LIA77_07779 [Sarocladium implicatum]
MSGFASHQPATPPHPTRLKCVPPGTPNQIMMFCSVAYAQSSISITELPKGTHYRAICTQEGPPSTLRFLSVVALACYVTIQHPCHGPSYSRPLGSLQAVHHSQPPPLNTIISATQPTSSISLAVGHRHYRCKFASVAVRALLSEQRTILESFQPTCLSSSNLRHVVSRSEAHLNTCETGRRLGRESETLFRIAKHRT